MGTTKDAFLAGSVAFAWVAAIEGYDRLLTNYSDLSAVVTAWAGSDWTAASGGLSVDMSIAQALSPDEPIGKMGSCNLWVQTMPGDDMFGVAIARKTSPYESYLSATLDNTADTVNVLSTAGADSSGFIHIGTECISYTGVTATSFTGCTRGRRSPFGTFSDYLGAFASRNFSHYHRVEQDQNSVNLTPRVTSLPRQWAGRLVAVYAHRIVGGALDVRAEAELVFAGRVLDAQDDANTGAAVIQVKGILEVFADATIGGSQWKGDGSDGITLGVGQTFGFTDTIQTGITGATTKTADALTVVSGAPANANEIQASSYTLTDLASALSAWLASETSAGRLSGTYSVGSPVSIPGGELRTKVYWTLGVVTQTVSWQFGMPTIAAAFFGFQEVVGDASGAGVVKSGSGSTAREHYYQNYPPAKAGIAVDGGPSATMVATTTSGTVLDQYDILPGGIKPSVSLGLPWGVFLFGDKRLMKASFVDNLDGTVTFQFIQPALYEPNPQPITVADDEQITVTQIYAFENDPATIVASLAIACGTDGYNTPYAALPLGCGAAIPYELISGLVLSMSGISTFATSSIDLLIEKPTKMSDLIGSDFGIRVAFLCWRDGGIQAGAWVIPTATLAIATLDETNKAEPAGNKTNQRSSTTETTEWLRQIVKIRYNRNATNPSGDDYKSTIEFEDRASVDDSGGGGVTVTLSLRNTYSEFAATGQSINSLLPHFMAMLPLFSRPARKVTRSIFSTLFFKLGLGDVVLLSDSFARDPETGLRRVVERPAMVTRMRSNFGGKTPGAAKATSAGGDVDLLFTDVNPDRVGASYVPSAVVDDTYSSGGYDHGYLASGPTLRCLDHAHSESTEIVDAANLQSGDKVLVVERDPLDPSAPLTWERTVLSVSGSDVTFTATLSTPAWDGSRRYRIVSQIYSAATSTQHVHVYQADDTSGLVDSTAQPYLYGSSAIDATYTPNAAAEVELLPVNSYVDGAGRDVGWESALVNLTNTLIDYKSATQIPCILDSVIENNDHDGYVLVAYAPIFLSYEVLTNAVFRYITCGLWAYSTDGTTTVARVTLSRERPSFSTIYDVPWSGTISQAEWLVTNTVGRILDDQTLTANVKDTLTGEAWISIEIGYKCGTRGIGKFVEGARQTI